MDQQWKRDDGKDRVDLLPIKPLLAAARVFGHGAAKYAPWSWRLVDDWRSRYYASTLRHLFAWRLGEDIDPDSDMPHLWHALTNLIIMVDMDEREEQ